MAITYFGRSVVPADGAAATNATTTITFTPPGSMTTGDLVYVCLQQRGTATFSNTTSGGQTWNALTRRTTTNVATQAFWCRYNGTWSTNPIFTFSAGTCTSGIMIVYRPTATTRFWAVDVPEVSSTFTAPTTPFTVSRAGLTATQDSTVSIASWFTADDNTWGSISGTGWNVTGDAQYRNTAGTDQSMTFAHKIQTSAGATGSVSKNQLTLGGDAGLTNIVTFYEFEPPTLFPKQIVTSEGTGNRTCALTSVTAGARIIVSITTEDDNEVTAGDATISDTATLTWTKVADAQSNNGSNTQIFTTVYTAGGNTTITGAWGTTNKSMVAYWVTGQETSPSGSSNTGLNQSNPSVSLTTGGTNSLVIGVTGDFNFIDGAARVYRFSETEALYSRVVSSYTAYHYYKIVPSAGTNSFGLTAPTMTSGANTALYEIKVATGATLSADPGTFTLTGNTANLLKGSVLSADPGTFALTGNDATLIKGYVLSADPGTFALTGNDTTLLYSRVLSADPGTFSLTGNTAELLKAYILSADGGTIILTGNDANLIKGYVLSADGGVFTLTGNDATLLKTFILSADPGAFTLTGNDATLTKTSQSLSADPGVFTLTGNDTNLLYSRVLQADPGSFTLTGNDADFRKTIVLQAEPGSFTLTGNDVNFLRAYVLSADGGVFTLTGNSIADVEAVTIDSGRPSVTIYGWPFKTGFGTTKLK